MDACFTTALEAHWKCTDEVNTSEAKHKACLDETSKIEIKLDSRWAINGQGVTEVRVRNYDEAN